MYITKIVRTTILTLSLLASGVSFGAAPILDWGPVAADWNIYLHHKRAIITSDSFPQSHCANPQWYIELESSEYDRALFSYALSAKARGLKIRFVFDRANPDCKIYALQEFK